MVQGQGLFGEVINCREGYRVKKTLYNQSSVAFFMYNYKDSKIYNEAYSLTKNIYDATKKMARRGNFLSNIAN